MFKNLQGKLQGTRNVLAIIALGLVCFFLLLIVLDFFGFNVQTLKQEMTVTGHSEKFIVPGAVQFSVYISSSGSDEGTATYQTSATAAEATKTLMSVLGVAEGDIVKPVFEVSSWEMESGARRYTSNGQLVFVLRDISKYNQVMALSRINGVSAVEPQNLNPEVLLKNLDRSVKEELEREALADAQKTIEQTASNLKAKIKGIQSYDYSIVIDTDRKPEVGTTDLNSVSLKIGYYATMETIVVYKLQLPFGQKPSENVTKKFDQEVMLDIEK